MGEAADFETPIPETPWVNFTSPSAAGLDAIAVREGFHPLEVEDCRHRNQIAKVAEHDAYTFIVIKTIHFDRETLALDFEDFDIFLKQQLLVTVEETDGGGLTARAIQRLDKTHAKRPWRIIHALLDVAVDDYLPVLDTVGDIIDQIESAVLEDPSPETLHRVLHLKRVLIEFRRNATAMREVLGHLMRSAPTNEDRFVYLRDVYDHLVRILDFIETYRDLVSGALDIYLSSIANRTNEIVKVLTIYGTIALPLIVITGFYGMNFPELPLLHSGHGAALVVGAMTASTLGIMIYFRRRGWM